MRPTGMLRALLLLVDKHEGCGLRKKVPHVHFSFNMMMGFENIHGWGMDSSNH